MTTIRFDTSTDEGRIESGQETDPLGDSVVSIEQGDVRPTFHLFSDGSVTLVGKTGIVVPNFGENGEIIGE